jgi:hypothetical protein
MQALKTYGPPVGSCNEIKRELWYKRHYEFCYKHHEYIEWKTYLQYVKRKYGPGHTAKDGWKLFCEHKAYCENRGEYLDWYQYEHSVGLKRKPYWTPSTDDDWGEDPTFRRPIPEIIARINRLAMERR